jgi:hypothetical protein
VREVMLDLQSTTLAVNPETGGLFIGMQNGTIRVFDRDLALIDEIPTRASQTILLVPDVPMNRLYAMPADGEAQLFA